MRHRERRNPNDLKSGAHRPNVPSTSRQRKDILTADGEIVETLGYENFRVELDNGITILASVGGKMRLNHIRLLTGDRVQVELSPYDLTRGRIAFRYNKRT